MFGRAVKFARPDAARSTKKEGPHGPSLIAVEDCPYRNLGGAILIAPAGALAARDTEFFFASVVTGPHE
jgi:hypothetical protein